MSTESILERITEGIAECAAGGIVHRPWHNLHYTLKTIWRPVTSEEDSSGEFVRVEFMMAHEGQNMPTRAPRLTSENQPSPKRPPPWYVGMSSDFTKSITGIDRKLQGRVLVAITEITKQPTKAHGDTIKPLTGQLQGYWRYRLGDHRLIYSPDQSTGNVTLLSFAPRGSIYVD